MKGVSCLLYRLGSVHELMVALDYEAHLLDIALLGQARDLLRPIAEQGLLVVSHLQAHVQPLVVVHAPALSLDSMGKEASALDLEGKCPALVEGLCDTNQLVLNSFLLSLEELRELAQALSCQLEGEEGCMDRLTVGVGSEEVRLSGEGVGYCKGLLRGSQPVLPL